MLFLVYFLVNFLVFFFSSYSFLKIKLNLAMLNVFLFLFYISFIIFFFPLFGNLICSNTLQIFLNNWILNVLFSLYMHFKTFSLCDIISYLTNKLFGSISKYLENLNTFYYLFIYNSVLINNDLCTFSILWNLLEFFPNV